MHQFFNKQDFSFVILTIWVISVSRFVHETSRSITSGVRIVLSMLIVILFVEHSRDITPLSPPIVIEQMVSVGFLRVHVTGYKAKGSHADTHYVATLIRTVLTQSLHSNFIIALAPTILLEKGKRLPWGWTHVYMDWTPGQSASWATVTIHIVLWLGNCARQACYRTIAWEGGADKPIKNIWTALANMHGSRHERDLQ